MLPLAAISLVAFALRYARFKWLLHRLDSPVPAIPGLLGYVAGFALTASPAKIGELIRIRYFADLGVPPQRVVACTVFERASDIVVLLALSMFLAAAAGFWLACAFALFAIFVVLALTRLAPRWTWPAYWLRRGGRRTVARFVRIVGEGLVAAKPFFRPLDFVISLALGLAVYGLQAAGFVYLMHAMNLAIPCGAAIGIYPLATLIGATSMLPGGIGTTEIAMVLLLHQLAVPPDVARVASLATRLATTSLAIAIGLLSAAYLEVRRAPVATPAN